jgi:hypothetical protein
MPNSFLVFSSEKLDWEISAGSVLSLNRNCHCGFASPVRPPAFGSDFGNGNNFSCIDNHEAVSGFFISYRLCAEFFSMIAAFHPH